MNDRRPFSRGTGVVLVLEGLLFVAVAAVAHPGVLARVFSLDLDPLESMQIRYIQIGFFCVGCFSLLWGFHEVIFQKPGPLLLLSMVCFVPVFVPFGFLGYGSDPDAWAVSFTAMKMQSTGEYFMSRPPGFPLFEHLARFLIPTTGWSGLFIANLIAGMTGALVWFLVPSRDSQDQVSLLAAATLVHPLYLMGMIAGMDYIWQTLFVSLSMVLLLRGLEDEETPRTLWLISAGVCLGVASGFRITSLAVLPVLLGAIFFAIPRIGTAAKALVLFLTVSLLTTFVCELPVLVNFGSRALSLQPDPVKPVIVVYRLLRSVFPIPLLILLPVGLMFLVLRWREIERIIRILIGTAAGVLAIVLPGFFLLPREPGYLTLCVPFLAILVVFTVPRLLVGPMIPLLAIWSFVSVPVVAPAPELPTTLVLRPEPGPLVEEAKVRYRNLRRTQQLLLITPKEKTAVVVGFDWATLATFHPEWETENGVLENPHFPVRYYDWIDPEQLRELKQAGYGIVVTEGSERFTQSKYGYDLLDEGAVYWDPKKRYYR